MFVLALSLYNTWNRGVFLLCKITNLLIYSILLNDIQKLDKIQHKHSLVAIQFPDTSAEKKYLVYYDERWDCKLFLNYKTVDRADEESVINKVSADLNVDKSQINCRYISSKVQECKLRSNGMPVPLLRNGYSIFNGTKYR